MEASKTPPPGGPATPPPPAGPPAPGGPAGERAGAGPRIAALLLALALAIICAVGVALMADVADKGVCEEIDRGQVLGTTYECYDFPASVEPVVLGAGWIGSVLAGIAAILALAFTIRGRGGRLLLLVTAAAAGFLVLSIIVAQL
jgi:hypothetical protein